VSSIIKQNLWTRQGILWPLFLVVGAGLGGMFAVVIVPDLAGIYISLAAIWGAVSGAVLCNKTVCKTEYYDGYDQLDGKPTVIREWHSLLYLPIHVWSTVAVCLAILASIGIGIHLMQRGGVGDLVANSGERPSSDPLIDTLKSIEAIPGVGASKEGLVNAPATAGFMATGSGAHHLPDTDIPVNELSALREELKLLRHEISRKVTGPDRVVGNPVPKATLPTPMRKWTHTDGRRITASLEQIKMGNPIQLGLHRADGKRFPMDLPKLSADDQRYVLQFLP